MDRQLEIDRVSKRYGAKIAIAPTDLEALARDGQIDPSVPPAAARQYRIDDVQAAPAQTSDPGPGA